MDRRRGSVERTRASEQPDRYPHALGQCKLGEFGAGGKGGQKGEGANWQRADENRGERGAGGGEEDPRILGKAVAGGVRGSCIVSPPFRLHCNKLHTFVGCFSAVVFLSTFRLSLSLCLSFRCPRFAPPALFVASGVPVLYMGAVQPIRPIHPALRSLRSLVPLPWCRSQCMSSSSLRNPMSLPSPCSRIPAFSSTVGE